ncbi:hypothetical protein D3C85_1274400 [compost metagenome]
MQIDAFQRGATGTRITETDVLETQTIAGQCACRQAAGIDHHRFRQVFIKTRQIEAILIKTTDGAETVAHRRLPLLEQHQVHGHLAEADVAMDGIDHHPGIRQIKRSGTQQPQAEPPAITAQRQAPVFGIETGERLAITLQ